MNGLEELKLIEKGIEWNKLDTVSYRIFKAKFITIEKELKAKEMYEKLIKEMWVSFKLENNKVVVCITSAPVHTVQNEELKKFILDNFILKEALK